MVNYNLLYLCEYEMQNEEFRFFCVAFEQPYLNDHTIHQCLLRDSIYLFSLTQTWVKH